MSEKRMKITFATDKDDFFDDLKEEANHYFTSKRISIYGNTFMYLKVLFLLLVYLMVYLTPFLFNVSQNQIFACYIFLGVWGLFLGVNVGHDAAHNSLFKQKKYNKWFMYIFDLLGLSSFNWKNRHVKGHHQYSNIMHYDPDIQQSPIVKIFPQDTHRVFHRFQWLYMPIVYAIFIPRWIFYRDFKDIFYEKIGGFNNRPYPSKEVIRMVLLKIVYITYIIILPSLVSGYGISVFIYAFLMLMVSSSLTILVVILTTHMLEHSEFPEPDENGVMPYSWAEHQMMTTSDYATNSFIITHLFGGFNHHVVHHLFQHVCHIHYPELTKIVVRVAAKHGIKYQSHRYILPAIYSHLKLLYNNGKQTNTLQV